MPEESIGDLSFKVRATLQQWRQDLAEADKEWEAKRAKWEKPVALRVAASQAGGGGVSAGGMGAVAGGGAAVASGLPAGSVSGGWTMPTASGGLNVLGTSNGDVSVRVEAMRMKQEVREANALKMAQRMIRQSGGDFTFDGGTAELADDGSGADRGTRASRAGRGGGGGVDADLMREARQIKREAERAGQIREQNEVQQQALRERVMAIKSRDPERWATLTGKATPLPSDYYRGVNAHVAKQFETHQMTREDGRSMQQAQQYSAPIGPNVAGAADQFEAMAAGGKQGLWQRLGSKVPHTALRSFAAVMVADGIAGEINNEENYKKAVRLAGLDQNKLGRAELQRYSGGFDAIPFVGGLLKNITNAGLSLVAPKYAPAAIETDLELAQMQRQYQDEGYRFGMGTVRTGLAARATAASPIGFTRRAYGILSGVLERRTSLESEYSAAEKNAGLESDPTEDDIEQARRKLHQPSIAGETSSRVMEEARGIMESRNLEKRKVLNAKFKRRREANDALQKSEEEDLSREGLYATRTAQAEVVRSDLAARFKPVEGGASAAVAMAKAMVDRVKRPAPEGYDASKPRDQMTAEQRAHFDEQQIMKSNVEAQVNQLRERQADVAQNFIWGRGQQYDPTVQSALAFTDRAVEGPQAQNDALQKAIEELTQVLKDLKK